MSDERAITGRADFRTVTVFERSGKAQPVYIVRFLNPEIPEGFLVSMAAVVGIMVVVFGGMLGGSWLMGWGHDIGIGWFVPLILSIVIIVVAFNKINPPWNYKRAIEIDIAVNALRVYRNNQLVSEHRLDFGNLTVEPHPDAERLRVQRSMNNQKRLYWEEKQHCLFGWFGIGGAQKVCLLCQIEYPYRNSLGEVQAAIMWARDKAHEDEKKRQLEQAGQPAPDRILGRGGMKPPLD